jgi:uncharacterized protein (TIGR02996 family)
VLDPIPPDLLAAILAAPYDPAPRLVLADLLTAAGDPRGEFIALDCLAAPTPRQQRRKAALQRHHHAAWLCGLESLVDRRTVRFDKGFLHTVGLERGPRPWPDPTDDVALVRVVSVTRDPRRPDLTPVLTRMVGLHTALGLRVSEWARLPVALEELALTGTGLPFLGSGGDRSRLRRLSLMIGSHPGRADRLLDVLQLDRLAVGRADVIAWLPHAKRVDELVVDSRDWRLRLTAEGREIHVEPLGGAPVARRVGDLITTLRALAGRDIRWVWVRGGPRPSTRAVQDIRRAARGTPLRLPAAWTSEDR